MNGKLRALAIAGTLLLGIGAGYAEARPAERVRTQPDAGILRKGTISYIGVAVATVVDPTSDESGTGVETVVYVEQKKGAPKAVKCPFVFIERGATEIRAEAECSVGKKARGARAFFTLDSFSYDGLDLEDIEYLESCEDKGRLRGRWAEFSCTVPAVPTP